MSTTTTEKIIEQAQVFARASVAFDRDGLQSSDDSRQEAGEDLRELIAAALADARREGAEAMRSAAVLACEEAENLAWKQYDPSHGGDCDPHQLGMSTGAGEVRRAIDALPLPTGERQAVLLTDEQVRQIGDATLYAGGVYDRVRAIETAVIAANGLETK